MRKLLQGICCLLSSGLFSCASNSSSENGLTDIQEDSTHVVMTWGTTSHIYSKADASLSGNKLDVSFSGGADRGIELSLTNIGKYWHVTGINQPAPTDSLHVSSQFSVLSEAIDLNTTPAKTGDKLSGSVYLMMLGKKSYYREALVPFIDTRKWDTVRVEGRFISNGDDMGILGK